MKLELKHLAPYLPYGVQVEITRNFYPKSVDIKALLPSDLEKLNAAPSLRVKPLLLPLSELHLIFNDFVNVMPYGEEYRSHLFLDEIKHTEKTDLYIIKSNVCAELIINKSQPLTAPYLAIQVMLENHYDVFGLIDAGLAIDKTIIK